MRTSGSLHPVIFSLCASHDCLKDTVAQLQLIIRQDNLTHPFSISCFQSFNGVDLLNKIIETLDLDNSKVIMMWHRILKSCRGVEMFLNQWHMKTLPKERKLCS